MEDSSEHSTSDIQTRGGEAAMRRGGQVVKSTNLRIYPELPRQIARHQYPCAVKAARRRGAARGAAAVRRKPSEPRRNGVGPSWGAWGRGLSQMHLRNGRKPHENIICALEYLKTSNEIPGITFRMSESTGPLGKPTRTTYIVSICVVGSSLQASDLAKVRYLHTMLNVDFQKDERNDHNGREHRMPDLRKQGTWGASLRRFSQVRASLRKLAQACARLAPGLRQDELNHNTKDEGRMNS